MGGSMYLVRGEELVEMTEQQYEREDHLQKWLAQHPGLLAGEQINSDNPRRWLLIGREFAVPSEEGGSGRWSLDHLFVDQDGIPTLVEVKRSIDTRSRREVVAQMLDYAANGMTYWPIATIQARFIADCEKKGIDPDVRIEEFRAVGTDVDSYWQIVRSNLETGRLRLMFVADTIPPELRRIVEFLNAQMDRTEVLAIEVKQFVGQDLTTLVPRVIGQTVQIQEKKAKVTGTSVGQRQWDEQQFTEMFSARNGTSEVNVVKRILDWSKPIGILWGKGKSDDWGSFYPELIHNGVRHYIFGVWTSGGIEILFERMKTRPPFDQENLRAEFASFLKQIPGMRELPASMLGKRPNFPLSLLTVGSNLDQFLSACNWYCEKVRSS